MSPAHIVQISGVYPPSIGGIQQQISRHCPRLRDLGFEVGVLTRSAGARAGSEVQDGVSLHRVHAAEEGALASFRFLTAGWRWLSALEPRPDLLHAHELVSATTLALRAKRHWALPIVLEVHTGGSAGTIARLLRKPFGRRRLRAAAALADRFIATSLEIQGELLGVGIAPERILALPNGVDCTAFAPPDDERTKRRRQELRIAKGGPVVVFAGRVADVKGIHCLLRAWPAVRASFDTATLVVVGDGPLRRLVEGQEGAGGVVATGGVADVTPYLEAADVFVLPSFTEGTSVALLEAMAVALPVVATRVGGTPDLIADGENGVLVEAGDARALTQGLCGLLAAPERRRAMGAAARRHVVRHHRLEERVERLAALYRELLSAGNRS